MKTIDVKYQKMQKSETDKLKSERPKSSHISTMITEECIVICDGKVIAIYKKANFSMSRILSTCMTLKFTPYKRTNGLVSDSININSIPRRPLRENKCSASSLRVNKPLKHQVFIDYAKLIAASYREYFKISFANQIKQSYVGARKIYPYYRIKGTPFSGGVINKNCAMNYHFDKANTRDGISCMMIMKENVSGGELILPELNIGFECNDEFILLFDGQKFLHGVTDIISARNGYRYTIVYYNNNGMHLCLPPEQEEEHYQNWLDRK